jgi:hypothetical protein
MAKTKRNIPGPAVQVAITALKVAIAAAPVSDGTVRLAGQIGVKCMEGGLGERVSCFRNVQE